MFKALNPFQLFVNLPIEEADLNPDFVKCRFLLRLNDTLAAEHGSPTKWLLGPEFLGYTMNVRYRGDKKDREILIGSFLIQTAHDVRKAIDSWKDDSENQGTSGQAGIRAWQPDDPTGVRSWFCPYLKCASMAELKSRLDDDIAMLKKHMENIRLPDTVART